MNTPAGFERIYGLGLTVKCGRAHAAYANEKEIVITGDPPSEDEDPKFELHNCDAMGCGWEHVLERIKRPYKYVADFQI